MLARLSAPTDLGTNLSGASTDAQLIELWLAGKASPHTRAAYAADAALFVGYVRKSLASVTVRDLQGWIDSLEGADATRARRVGAVRSLLSFGLRTGYLRFDVGRAVRPPQAPTKLATRILEVEDVHKLIAAAETDRDSVMLRLLYVSGIRVAELCGLTWTDTAPRGDAGVITVLGKGGKRRTVLLTPRAWHELAALRGDAEDGSPVFPSRTGRHLDRSAVLRVVQRTCKAARIRRPVSPHWLRHAHASHALDAGAPVHLVSATLGHASLATTSRYTHARPSESSATFIRA